MQPCVVDPSQVPGALVDTDIPSIVVDIDAIHQFPEFLRRVSAHVRCQPLPHGEQWEQGDYVGPEDLLPTEGLDERHEQKEIQRGHEHYQEDAWIPSRELEDPDPLSLAGGVLEDASCLVGPEMMEGCEEGAETAQSLRYAGGVDRFLDEGNGTARCLDCFLEGVDVREFVAEGYPDGIMLAVQLLLDE